MQGFNINEVDVPPSTVGGQIVPPTGGGGWAVNCRPGIDGTTPDADMFNDLLGNILRVCEVAGVKATPNRFDDLVDSINLLVEGTIGSVTFVPVAAMLPFAASTPPTGFLLANGAALSRVSYAKLFQEIGTMYGPGDGETTFNLPDTRGVGLRGLDSGRGLDPGRTLGSYQADTLASHDHPVNDPPHGHNVADPLHVHSHNDQGHDHYVGDVITNLPGNEPLSGQPTAPITQIGQRTSVATAGISINAAATGIGIYGSTSGVSVGAAGGAETRGKNLAVNYIIKY
ncbi:tail fiber protein [Paraburkholderia youngii]|uniref:tail fiber protein n=1 Tax=Paraburkholderia youngii TaxID=2782701 RepID=UPI001591FAB7|nr:tail fiber protein [Paraburkholderia youngii]NUX55914.1 tail fiber protein [Paraburkholderia youngii]